MIDHATAPAFLKFRRRTTSPAIAALLLLLSTLATVAGGCVTTTKPVSPYRPNTSVTVKTETPDRAVPAAPRVAPKPAEKQGVSPNVSVADDACPKALHELCGPLLLYFAAHRQLPPTLDVLRDLAGETEPALLIACPKSKRDYTYDPSSQLRDGLGDRIIIYDAVPAHAKGRWAIAIREPVPGKPLVTKVIPIAEELFLKWQAAASDEPAPKAE